MVMEEKRSSGLLRTLLTFDFGIHNARLERCPRRRVGGHPRARGALGPRHSPEQCRTCVRTYERPLAAAAAAVYLLLRPPI